MLEVKVIKIYSREPIEPQFFWRFFANATLMLGV